MTDFELINAIEESDTWDYDLCKEACDRAGLSEEWKESDGETFESVVDKAIEILKSRNE